MNVYFTQDPHPTPTSPMSSVTVHDDVIKWKHFSRYWPFMRGIHRSPVNSPHKGQWRGALMFSLICAWINSWVNNREAGDLRRYRTHYDVSVVCPLYIFSCCQEMCVFVFGNNRTDCLRFVIILLMQLSCISQILYTTVKSLCNRIQFATAL